METQSKSLSGWKKLAIFSAFGGVGFALMSGLLIAAFFWYSARQARPKPWITNVIVATDSPGFEVSDDGKSIEFTYTLENQGSSDYRIESYSDIQIFGRGKDGTLSPPLPDPIKDIQVPIFIPAKQKALVQLSLPFGVIPTRAASVSKSAFHEQIRAYLEQNYSNVGGFVIFDNANHYEIDLQKWLASPPPNQTAHRPH